MSVFAGTLSDSLAYRLADVRFGSFADIARGHEAGQLLSATYFKAAVSPPPNR